MTHTQQDQFFRCTFSKDTIRLIVLDATQLCHELNQLHACTGVVRSIFSEIICSSLLTSPLLTEEERYTIRWYYDGPFESCIVDIGANAKIRAYPTNSYLEGIESIDQALGKSGKIGVVKSNPYRKLNSGMTLADQTQPAKDLATFFEISDQLKTILVYNEHADRHTAIMVQAMPGFTETNFEKLYSLFESMDFKSKFSEANFNNIEGFFKQFDVFKDIKIKQPTQPELFCTCSRDKMFQILCTLGIEDLQDMIANDGGSEVDCDFCKKKHIFDTTDLQKIIDYKKSS